VGKSNTRSNIRRDFHQQTPIVLPFEKERDSWRKSGVVVVDGHNIRVFEMRVFVLQFICNE
jgi:hypothetical protein